MQYKGYTARITFDEEAMTFHGRVIGIRDIVTFQSDSAAGLMKEFRDSVDDYLEFCAETGKAPDKPFSGRFLVRAEPGLHRRVSQAAAARGETLNQYVVGALAGRLAAEDQGVVPVETSDTAPSPSE